MARREFTLRLMRLGWHNALSSVFIRVWIVASLLFVVSRVPAASLQTFSAVFGQITNDIASIESSFDNSPGQKRMLAALIGARGAILNPDSHDEQALAKLVDLLGNNGDFSAALDEAALNARAVLFSQYESIAARLAGLPPSSRTTMARTHFGNLAPDADALAAAQHAAGISNLLAPFGRRLESVAALVARAETLPRPTIRINSVRATVNGRRFVSSGDGARSPNLFDVSAPDALYLQVFCRVVDRQRVITFTLPVLTAESGYDVAQGLAALTYTDNVFAAVAMTLNATSGTVFAQRDRDEVYGVFSAEGPGFNLKDGRFRIKLPRELRGN